MSPGCFDFIDQSESDYRSWVTSLRDCYRRRRKSALLTNGSGSSCWRTPDAPGAGGPRNRQESMGEGHQTTVAEQAEHWGTPNAHDATGPLGAGFELTDHHYRPHDLAKHAEQWSTPTPWQQNESPETWEARKARNLAKGYNGNGMGTPLDQQVQQWQTPGTDSFRSRGLERKDEMGLDQQARNWQSPQSRDYLSGLIEPETAAKHVGSRPLNEEVLNWPSPRSEDSESCGNHPNATDSLRGAVGNWVTPHGAMGQEANGDYGSGGEFAKQAVNWNPRISSLPTEPGRGKNGKRSSEPIGGSGLRWVHSTSSIIPYDGLVYSLWAWRPIPCLRRKKGKRVSLPKSGKPFVRPAFRRRLNVFFDLWLMGWSPHWVCRESIACGQSETESFLSRQRSHLSCLLNRCRSGNGMENSLESVDGYGRDEIEEDVVRLKASGEGCSNHEEVNL